MKLRKRQETEMRMMESATQPMQAEAIKMQSIPTKSEEKSPPVDAPIMEEVECEVWEDIDGNVYAYTPLGSGVISIEVKSEDEDIVNTYKALKQKPPQTAEERIAQLEDALAKALKRLADLEAK